MVAREGELADGAPPRLKRSKKRRAVLGGGGAEVGYAVGQVAGSLKLGEGPGCSAGPLAALFSGCGGGSAPIYAPVPRSEAAPQKTEVGAATRGRQAPGKGKETAGSPLPKKPRPPQECEQLVAAREGPLKEADQQEELRERQAQQRRLKRREVLQIGEDDDPGAPRRGIHPIDRAQERLKDQRTVFVGNLPVSFTKGMLRAHFRAFGVIESVRFRSVARAEPTLSRKVAAIQRQVHPKRKSLNAYVVFKEEEAAGRALASNGTQVPGGFNIRVDRAAPTTEGHDNKRSAFVGNLPYDIEEQALRGHFVQCGEVVGVRIIRDRETGVGKGFGYVLFDGTDAVQLALKLDNSQLIGRKLRVKRCVQQDTSQRSGAGHRKFAGAVHKLDSSVKDRKKRPSFQFNKKDGADKAKNKRPSFQFNKQGATDKAKNTGQHHPPDKAGGDKGKKSGQQRVPQKKPRD